MDDKFPILLTTQNKTTMYKNLKVILLGILLISIFNSSFGQNVWESFGTSSSPWGISSKLTTYSNTVSKIDVKNLNNQTQEDRKNGTWSAENVWINLSSYNEAHLDINFTVKNVIPSSYVNPYHNYNQWYWSVSVDYTNTSGQDKYFHLNYFTGKNSNSYYTYEESCITDNGTQSKWESTSSLDYRKFRILFEDNTVKIYDTNGSKLVKTIYDVKKLRFIQVGAGPGTNLQITNTSCLKKTIYGQSLPYIQKAASYLSNDNPSSAASEMTSAINKGLKCYDTYLTRGVAYYTMGYYKSAIEDLTTALTYSANNKELAYYYRGMSKLALDDDYGINDLKNGGQDGLVFLRENNLMNYVPGQSKKKTTTPKKKTNTSQPKKPALRKK